MTKLKKFYDVKLPNDVLRYSLHYIPKALLILELVENEYNRQEIREINSALIEVLSHLSKPLCE
ncbi:MAG TPA: hypothetical protein PLH40_07520 [Bacteroidales bacterium]|nr:hypothetical protein [Bacteroidales bacterium]